MRKLLALLLALFVATAPAFAYKIGIKKFGHNYFGTGSDGTVTISSNTNLTSTTDGDFVIKEYDTLTVNSGVTLSVSNRCKGLIIYVKNNCTVNGTITMTAKGPNLASPTEGIAFPRHLDSAGVKGLVTDYRSVATGGAGGAGSVVVGNPGGTITNGTGGGGSGGSGYNTSGAGAAGTSFSGGTGGGGGNSGSSGTSGATNGGAGGNGGATGAVGSGGGAGNPGGSGANGGSSGSTGTGGFLSLIVGGNLTIGAAGVISCDGVNGGSGGATGSYPGGGGASGGGRVVVLYAGTLSNSGTVRANGGSGGGPGGQPGGSGGAGQVTGPTKVSKE